jgi:hypothetical protein
MYRHSLYPTLVLAGLVAVTVGFVTIGLPTLFSRAQWAPSQQQKQVKEFLSRSGLADISPGNGQSVYSVGSMITMDIKVSMLNEHISGFTIPIAYDVNRFSFVSAEDVSDQYNVYVRREPKYVVIVGVEKVVGSVANTALDKTPMARLTFRALSPGPGTIQVAKSIQSGYKLKLNNASNKAIEPANSQSIVTIQ